MPVKRAGKLETIGPKAENGLKRGLILSGKLVSQRASRKAPVKTGRLKRSITEGQPYVIASLDLAIDVGTNVVYAPIHEFGIRVRPQPYLRPALAESRADIRRILVNSVVGAIKGDK